MNKSTLKRVISLTARLAITAGLLGYVLAKIDVAALKSRLLDFSPYYVAVAVLILLAQVFVGAVRWSAVIRTIHTPVQFRTVQQLIFVGMFFNQTLPSSIGGDALRVWHIYRHGLPLRAAFNSVLLDRVVATAGLLVIMLATLPLLFDLVGSEHIRLGVVIAIFLMAAGMGVLYALKSLPAFLTKWRLGRALQNLSRDLHAIINVPRGALLVMAVSVLLHVMTSLVVFVLGQGLSLPLGIVDCLVLVPPVILLTILPISMAGWGVREFGMISALGYAGIAPTDALLISVTFGALVVLLSLPGGWFWLMKRYHAPHAEISFSEAEGEGRKA